MIRRLLIAIALSIAAGCAPLQPASEYAWVPSPTERSALQRVVD